MTATRWYFSLAMCITGALALVRMVGAADAPKLDAVAEKGVTYLITKGQAADGSFTKQAGIGITALCTSALLRNGRGPNDPAVAKSLKVGQKVMVAVNPADPAEAERVNFVTAILSPFLMIAFGVIVVAYKLGLTK